METTKLDFINDFTLLPENIRIKILEKNMENDKDKAYIRELINEELTDAVCEGNNEIVNMMIRFGADKDVKDEWGITPLHLAVMCGQTGTVKLLLDAGVKDKDGICVHGRTPLHHAVWDGHTDIVKLLLDAGADMEVEDDWGMTPLQKAAREGHTEIVNLLVNAGADITKEKDFHWGTPLHLAAQKGHTEIVKVFLDVGVDISREIGGMFIPVCERFYKDWQDDDGATPLHLAAKEGHIEIVKLLLDAGASTYIKNNNGESPEDLVTGTCPGYKPYQDIKKLLNYTWLQRFSARADV